MNVNEAKNSLSQALGVSHLSVAESTHLGEAQCSPPPRRLFTLAKFSKRHSSFLTLSAVTNQVFDAQPRQSTKGEIPGNGMLEYGVIVRIGRRVLIDEDAYFRWLDAQQIGRQP